MLVRLANIMKEIELLPNNLLSTPSAKQVADWYKQSFKELLIFEDAEGDCQEIPKFNDQLQIILKRHSTVVQTMAEGLIELKEMIGAVDMGSEQSIQYFLDRFYLNRISIRMLQYQHLVVFGSVLPESPRHVGCIDPMCDVESVLRDAYENARFLCDRYYMTSPQMELECLNALSPEKKISIVAVPSHLYHILFELFKNAMRATVEYIGVDEDLPPMQVRVVRGQEDLSIKISDRGGGVSRNVLSKLFHYMYTTAPPPPRDGSQQQAPLAGFGFGLPLMSRLYARYFLGDLFLVSMEHQSFVHFHIWHAQMQKTLGEEYVGLVQINSNSNRQLPSIWQRILQIFVDIFAQSGLLSNAFTNSKYFNTLRLLNIYHFEAILFLFGFTNYKLGKTLARISYLSTRPQQNFFPFSLRILIGLSALIQFIAILIFDIVKLRGENAQPTTNQIIKRTRECKICSSNVQNVSLTCGHLLCISCLNDFIDTETQMVKCPYCRNKYHFSRTIPLLNF